MPSSSPFSPSTITFPQLHHLATTLYPAVVERVIRQKHSRKSKPADIDKAASEFFELDRFRYGELPDWLGKRKGERGEMEMEDVQRLMKWKITRGSFRPTLLPLLSSNNSSAISKTTSQAFKIYKDNNPPSAYLEALSTLCTLRGIGPATASLILSVLDRENVPFFSDEVFAWLEGGKQGLAGQKVKMKYDMKEYGRVWEGVKAVQDRVAKDGDGKLMTAEMVEKATFVIGHWEVLTEEEEKMEVCGKDKDEDEDEASKQRCQDNEAGEKKEKEKEKEPDVTPVRRSKRRKLER